MNTRSRLSVLLAFVVAAMAFASGCDDDTGGAPSKPEIVVPDRPEQPDPVDHPSLAVDTGEPADVSVVPAVLLFKLSVIGDDEIELNYLNETQLQVLYTDGDGVPVRGAAVSFDFAGSADEVVLSDRVASTNASGLAEVTLTTGRTRGTYVVNVSAPQALPVQFTIDVTPKGAAQYIVHSDYSGGTELDHVVVELYSQNITCDQIDPFALPVASVDQVVPYQPVVGIGDGRFTSLPNGNSYTAVTIGYLDPTVPAAYGCDDSRPVISDGFDREVTVVLDEFLPDVAGTYDIETRVDMVDALPEPLATGINVVGTFFTDPGEGVVLLLLGDPGDPDDGLLGSDFAVFDQGWLRDLIVQVVNDLIDPLISSNLQDVFDVGGALYTSITDFTLQGQLEIVREPVPGSGQLAMHNIHRYDRVVLNWPVGCGPTDPPDCGQRILSMNELGQVGFLSGEFGGTFTVLNDQAYLQIDRHGFQFNIGAFVLAIIEQLVFPQIFGDDVDTVGEVLGQIIDCQAIADGVFPAANDAWANDLLVQACDGMLGGLETMIVDSIVDVDADVPNLTVATPTPVTDADIPSVACPMDEPVYDVDSERRQYGTLGSETDRCQWDMRLETNAETRYLDSDFYGARL